MTDVDMQKYLKAINKLLDIKESECFKEPVNYKEVSHQIIVAGSH